MESKDLIKWDAEMGGISSKGEISFEHREPKRGAQHQWPELVRSLGAALIQVAERWQENQEGQVDE